MHITEALFGRKSATVCPHESAQGVLNCSEPTALQTAARMCNNRQMCDVNVTNVAFGEPCAGVSKYLSVSFICGGKISSVPRCFYR